MEKLNVKDTLARIKAGKTFEATIVEGGFVLKINKYVPYFCVAPHSGNTMREELLRKINHNKHERWYEEDPYTDAFIRALPITLIGLDSRYEYDLNRSPEKCIYDVAWGKEVWQKTLTQKERKLSLSKHQAFYAVLHALLEQLEERYGNCVVYDIHSYNSKRIKKETPLFNIGTTYIDLERWQNTVSEWETMLSAITIKGVPNVTRVNDVFQGRGYIAEYVAHHFKNVLVLPTEIKKVYCNELTGETYPMVIKELQQRFKKTILEHALAFTNSIVNILR